MPQFSKFSIRKTFRRYDEEEFSLIIAFFSVLRKKITFRMFIFAADL